MDIDELLAQADRVLSAGKKQGRKRKKKVRDKTTQKAKAGQRWVSSDGVEKIYDANGNIKQYHRWIIEQHIGRPLIRSERVAWKDGNKLNNDISNLQLLTDQPVDFSKVICKHCGKTIA